jgi:sulfinoalanine decarboxylase
MDLEKAIEKSSEIAKALIQAEKDQPVLPLHTKSEYEAMIDLGLSEEGCAEDLFFEQISQIAHLTPKTNSHRFFNQLFAGRSAPSLAADILSTVLNTTMHTYKVAGIQVLVEQETVQQFLQKVGYTAGEGIINPGGSMSNMVSMMIARNEKAPEIMHQGFSHNKLISYTSDEGHYSIKKNAAFLGLGKDNVRLVKTDDRGRILAEDFEQQVIKDLEAGLLPFYINATAGTTVLGAFDPFEEIAAICKKYDIWFHIDGALGGSALMSEQYKHLVKGSELSDSFTWNAHKMMNVPITASFLLLKERGLLHKHISEKADYLFQNEGLDLDLGNMSIQCGRRVDAFKVWAAWKYYGAKGLEKRIDHLFAMAKHAAKIIKEDPNLELFRAPESVNVCFNVKGVDPEAICAQLHKEGMAMVGYSKTKGAKFIRIAFINADISLKEVEEFLHLVKAAAKEI